MIDFSVREVSEVTRGKMESVSPAETIKGFSIDTRTIKSGEFYIAIKGKNHDGHNYVNEAISKGACGIIIENADIEIKGNPSHKIIVKDSLKALADIADAVRRKVNIPVVCITGTNGKTTVKDLTGHILSKRFKVLKSEKSFNNIIGLSLTLLNLEKTHDVAILELGTNHPGEIIELANIARPKIAVINNIGNGHIEHFGSREGVFKEKASLLDALGKSGKAFLNGDDDFLKNVKKDRINIKFFGQSEKCDLKIENIEKKENGFEFVFDKVNYRLPLEGVHNVYNASIAIALAKELGLSDEDIKDALGSVKLPGMRLERQVIDGVVFINDSYNANPDSFESAINAFQGMRSSAKKIIVAGDMLELGPSSTELHKNLGRKIKNSNVDFLVTLGGYAKYIAQGAIEAGMDPEKVVSTANHSDAANILMEIAKEKDMVLVKGSRASKMEEILRCYTTSCIH